jgi:iron complex outermembrane receptor protein/vitamin B12 transporter
MYRCQEKGNDILRFNCKQRAASIIFIALAASTAARAVVVRGHVTDASGRPLPASIVRLIEGGKVAAIAYADSDGAYEIRSADGGRFTLLGSARGFLPGVGTSFYGGETDVLQQDVVLAINTVHQEVSATETRLTVPLPQLASPLTIIPGEALELQLGVVDTMRQMPGAFVVQTGQMGGQTSLFLRGGDAADNFVQIDGVPADDIGGSFDFGTVSSTAVGSISIMRGADSAVYGTGAAAGVVSIDTPRATTLEPILDYTGEAGSLYTYRNEVSIGGMHRRVDYYGAFSRLDTSNALPLDEYHVETTAIDFGYAFNANTTARFTIRNADSAVGLPGAHDFLGISNSGKQADQDLYSGLTVENRYDDRWHNLLRYTIARKREQQMQFGQQGTLIDTPVYGPEYFGNLMTIRGANGYRAAGRATIYGTNDNQDSNHDQLYYQSDYTFSPHVIALFGFRFDDERGSFNLPAYDQFQSAQRLNFEYNLGFQGEFHHRVFYSAEGAVEKNHLYGIAGTPRVGLSYLPVRPSFRLFHGTRLRASAATGVQEPALTVQFQSLYTMLQAAGDTADINRYGITPSSAERSRTYDVGVDQNIFGEKLVLKGGYFHNVFDQQIEAVGATELAQYFGLTIHPSAGAYDAYLNSLALRAQGAEFEVVWQPKPHLLMRGGYTYLAPKVVQSFASDAVAANQGVPVENPNLPGIAIGAEGPLAGARPFRRPPDTGYFNVVYTRPRLTLLLKGAMASKSDDSTFLDGQDVTNGNTLLLPNRDLDFGYAKMDLGFVYMLKHGFSYFAQINNLLNDQHIGPIGYPGLPLTFITGLRLRVGGD